MLPSRFIEAAAAAAAVAIVTWTHTGATVAASVQEATSQRTQRNSTGWTSHILHFCTMADAIGEAAGSSITNTTSAAITPTHFIPSSLLLLLLRCHNEYAVAASVARIKALQATLMPSSDAVDDEESEEAEMARQFAEQEGK